MKIVFMGTPEFAVPTLQRIIEESHEVLAVYTQPDKPQGRKMVLTPPPIKECALSHNIPVFQPTTFKDESVVAELSVFNPDVIVVVAYGKILPENVLSIPKYGCINVHASLLPKYRGAGPIQWSVIDGEEKTGVTTMYMEKGLDTGDMILKSETKIGENETAGELHDRLSELGGNLLIETLALIEKGTAPREKQDDEESCYAPMLSKDLSPIDFNKSAKTVHNLIRGLHPWPVATTTFEGKKLKIHKSVLHLDKSGRPSEILSSDKFIVACADGAVEFLEVQLEGSKKMNTTDFLRGHKIAKGEF
ncbi:MAG: methionyl-tRNA formyltransferase, partial [Oscillospiraceae bacterium]|nr:methionyl-tRNA formyltransferase [Oscillospiraceae bacterium]